MISKGLDYSLSMRHRVSLKIILNVSTYINADNTVIYVTAILDLPILPVNPSYIPKNTTFNNLGIVDMPLTLRYIIHHKNMLYIPKRIGNF